MNQGSIIHLLSLQLYFIHFLNSRLLIEKFHFYLGTSSKTSCRTSHNFTIFIRTFVHLYFSDHILYVLKSVNIAKFECFFSFYKLYPHFFQSFRYFFSHFHLIFFNYSINNIVYVSIWRAIIFKVSSAWVFFEANEGFFKLLVLLSFNKNL